jgi:predicted neuraminidase
MVRQTQDQRGEEHMSMDGIVRSGFMFESAAFPSCHAATLLETKDGLLASYFGGTHERHADVCIYTSRLVGQTWQPPVCVADGIDRDTRYPTWNPVLFRPLGGPIILFYKVGPSPSTWWGMYKTSTDDGRTWSDAVRLPDGILGPIKNKPVQLFDGTILSPTSIEGPDIGWRVYFERSEDGGNTWDRTAFVEQPADIKAIQPSILVHSDRHLQAIGRTQKNKRIFSTWSEDAGRTWSRMELLDIPNCNSGTDAVTLESGEHLLIYNHSDTNKFRYPINLASSSDGRAWQAAGVLEADPPGQYSYPCIIQTQNGRVHVAYTWKRLRMKHVEIDPNRLCRVGLENAVKPVPAGTELHSESAVFRRETT